MVSLKLRATHHAITLALAFAGGVSYERATAGRERPASTTQPTPEERAPSPQQAPPLPKSSPGKAVSGATCR
jgi:hypothetical protein